MRSEAKTVKEYLAELPPERRRVISRIRSVVRKNIPTGYKELMQYGMIGYVVPLSFYPNGYLDDPKTPLPFVSLASQKNYMSLYLMNIYADKNAEERLRHEWKKAGKKLNMGKSCIRFRHLEDIPLTAVADAVSRPSVKKFIELYEQSRRK